jgi:two-component system, NarL family, sensor kinase
VLVAFALVGGLGATPTFRPIGVQVPLWSVALLSLAFLAFSAVGSLVATRHPTNCVGWLFLSIGLSAGLSLAAIAYVEIALPARRWAEWAAGWISVGPVALIVFVLLLFPDGRLPSPRWRLVAWANALAALVMVVGGA